MSKPGGFLIRRAKERRRAFWEKHGWRVPLLAAVPIVMAAAFTQLRNPLAPWVSRGEINAFWIGAGIVGTVCTILYILGLDGAQNLRQGAEAERWTAQALRPLRRQGWEDFHDIELDGRNIDHALVGPRGAIAVETKWTADEVQIDESGIRRKTLDGRQRRDTRQLLDAHRHARDLSNLLQKAGVHAEVLPLLVMWGPCVGHIGAGAQWINGALVVVGGQSSQWLRWLKPRPLGRQAGDRAIEALRAHQPGRPLVTVRSRASRRDPAGHPVGPADPWTRADTPPLPPPAGRGREQPNPSSRPGPEDPSLLDALRRWRLEMAKAEGVPAYVVFHDRHIHAMAQRRPATIRDLSECPGVGPTKLARYGEALLRVLAASGEEESSG
jgi:hypothetical protein